MSLSPDHMEENIDYRAEHARAIRYIRAKVDQLLQLMGTLPLRTEELDDRTLIDLDPIGILGDSFAQVLEHVNQTNSDLELARRETRAILDAMGAAVVVVGQGIVRECNSPALEWLFGGASYGEVIGHSVDEACRCGQNVEKILSCTAGAEWDMTIGDRHFHVVTSCVGGMQEECQQVFVCLDVSRQKELEASLALYAKTFNHTAEGIVITDSDNRIVKVNDAFCTISGYQPDEVLGKNPRTFQSGMHDREFYRNMWRSIRDRGYWQGEILDRNKAGGIVPLLQTISEIRDTRGELTNYVSIITDITSLKETQNRLEFLAHHDALTNLPNRLLLTDRLAQAIERARRRDESFAVLFIDLDRFKTLNDSLGHQIGDSFLVEVAERLGTLVRRSDTVARLGGDEFVVVAEQMESTEQAHRMADKIVEAVKQPYRVNGRDLHIGCSIGIAMYPEDGDDSVTLLKNADAAMYKVKEAGRDGSFKFNRELSEAALEKLTLETALREGVKQERFQLHYQPILDLDSGTVSSVEALIRWHDPELGQVRPDKFIPLAEETKLIIPIGDWVLRKALEDFSAWRSRGMDLEYVSVNVSAAQIFSSGFAEGLIRELERLQIPGRSLQIELTENVLMRDTDTCRHVLNYLRDHGVRVAIDDFGTGYSSLSYLKQLPIDNLKIDRSFVRDVPDDGNDCAIVHAIVGMAHALGLATIAEGIETPDQEEFLTDIGCHRVQGFLYARPLPEAEFFDYANRVNREAV